VISPYSSQPAGLYGNGTLVGLPTHLIRRLQSVQNAAARLIFRLRRSDHITDALICLHWLRVPGRIVFKVAMQTYRALHGDAPQYLRQKTSVADIPSRQRYGRGLPPRTICKAHNVSNHSYIGDFRSHMDVLRILKQESCAITKMTALCALYMGALKIFWTP